MGLEWTVGSGAVDVGAIIPNEVASRVCLDSVFELSDWLALGGAGNLKRDTTSGRSVVSFAPCAASLDGDGCRRVALSVDWPEVGVEAAFVDDVGTSKSLDTGCGGSKGREGCDVVHVD